MNIKRYIQQLFKPSNSLIKYFDEIFVIAFKDEVKTRKLIHQYFSKYNIDFTFVDAVDGFKSQQLIKHYNKYLGWPYNLNVIHPLEKRYRRKLIKSPGALGLLQTYENIFEYSIEKKHNNILIFEDDVIFDADILNKYRDLNSKLGNNYDLIYLGASHHIWNQPTILSGKNSVVQFYKAPSIIDGSFAVAYNKKIFPDLLNVIKPKNAPMDVCLRSIVDKNNSYIFIFFGL
jgi:GR25 family glycosyltransferase involved in LPS biosynthesis